MRLRRVCVSGFKTFARRTDIVLGTGITAVVGPNGSGKSNLVDAVRWALGETNARELRGARMDEVIYSGGQGRGPMGMAQVEVVLDNAEGRLPLEDTEVSIARRVTRGGDSEYRLNGGRVRLRDLERILSATGLTQNGYAVVAQNDVDGIIEASPTQRRTLVEEAAGVRGLRAAREDAFHRIGGVETRLLRLADALSEAEPRLAELEEQASVAVDHAGLAARLRELRGSLAREEWRAARALARRARQRLATAISRAEAATEAELGFTSRLESERGRLTQARAAHAEAIARLEAARLGAERAAGDGRRWTDHAGSAALHRAAAGAELAAAAVELEEQRRLVAALGDSGAAAEAALADLEGRLAGLRAAHADADAAARAGAERLGAGERELAAAEQTEAAAAAVVRDHEARAALLEEAADALRGEIAAAAERIAELGRRTTEATDRAAHVEARHGALREQAAAARLEVDRAGAAVGAARAAEAAAHTAAREAAARVAALRGQIDGALGGGAVAEAVAAGRLAGVRVVETLRVVDPADAAAIEAALEDHLGAWLVEDLDAAAALLRGSGSREEVLASGLPAPAPTSAPGGVRAAVSAVEVGPAARGAVAHCLAGIWLAPDLAAAHAAVAAAGGWAVLPDGVRVGPAGLRGGGRPGATVKLAAAEREAGRAASAAGMVEQEAAAATRAAAERLAAAERTLAAAVTEVEGVRAEAADATAAAAAVRAAAAAEQARLETLEAERDDRVRAASWARSAAASATAEAERRRAAVAAAAGVVSVDRRGMEAARQELEAASDALRAQELDAARAEPEAREIQRRLATARHALAAAEQRSWIGELRLAAAEEAAVTALARITAAATVIERAGEEVDRAGAAVAAASAPAAGSEALVAGLEAERSEVAVAAARAADERAAAAADLADCDARVADLASAVREDETDEGPEPDAAAAERAEREISRLERRITALGPVNALAPEQHGALRDRVSSLRRDHDDLAGGCIDVRAIAAHLSVEIETRFDAVFGAVAYHFRMVFEELFPRGRATLRLTTPPPPDPDQAVPAEPVAPGVEILAQPPGKRLQPLSLLSGGERALTALAMILALEQVNPSPFYVFDEVDAPLDDANIGRFTRLLRRLATTQQFLVVTHNHATMAAADVLYGVTMEQDGTSRLLSVRLVDGQPIEQSAEAVVAV